MKDQGLPGRTITERKKRMVLLYNQLIQRFCFLTAVICIILFSSCRYSKSNKSQLTQSPNNPTSASFFDDGFKILGYTADQGVDPRRPEYEVTDLAGNPIKQNTGFALDLGRTKKGDIIFVWPNKVDRSIFRNYSWVSGQMAQYSQLTGLSVTRETDQQSRACWLDKARGEQMRAIDNALQTKNTDTWCRAVVHQLVNQLLPTGFDFRQYGNCGEGAKIGACLAKKASFRDDEIRICRSLNDHVFSLLRYKNATDSAGGDRQWCLLDRWSILPNFTCQLEWNEQTGEILHQGIPISKEQDKRGFFKKVACVSLDSYIKSSGNSLKNGLFAVQRGVCSGRIKNE